MLIQVIDSRRYLQEFSTKNGLPYFILSVFLLSVGDCEKGNAAALKKSLI